MSNLDLGKVNTQAGVPGLNHNDAYKVKTPFPPKTVYSSTCPIGGCV